MTQTDCDCIICRYGRKEVSADDVIQTLNEQLNDICWQNRYKEALIPNASCYNYGDRGCPAIWEEKCTSSKVRKCKIRDED